MMAILYLSYGIIAVWPWLTFTQSDGDGHCTCPPGKCIGHNREMGAPNAGLVVRTAQMTWCLKLQSAEVSGDCSEE